MPLNRFTVFLVVGFFSLLETPARGEEPPGRLGFRSYGTEAGVDNYDLSWMIQDKEGFIWVCAADAVYRFDGGRFERFGREAGLPSTSVSDITLDARGHLMLATRAGVVRWEDDHFVGVPMPGVAARVWSLRVDVRGRMWAGTEKGLYWEDSPEHFIAAPGWPGGPALKLWTDGSGALQAVSETRLVSRDPRGRWSIHEAPGRTTLITALVRDGQGRLWLGAEGWLAMQPRPGAALEERSSVLRGLPGAGNRLRVGKEGQLLVPHYGGLLEIRGERATVLRLGLSNQSARMRDVLEDRQGTLWAASMGVHRSLGRGLWSVHDTTTGLPANMVWGLARGADGTLWVGTDKGLVRGTAAGWVPVPGLEGYSLKAVSVDGDGVVWAAGNPAGLHRYEPWSGRLRTFGPESGYMFRYTFGMQWTPDGALWVATPSGFARGVFKAGVPSFSLVLPTTQRVFAMDLALDAAGRLWAPGNGLNVREGASFRSFGVADGLRDDQLRYVLVRRDGRLCVSYVEPLGVSCFAYREGRLTDFTHLDRGQGLHSNVVYQLGEDAAGRLWVGTGAGVHVVGPDGVPEHFGASGGAPGNESTGNSFLADADGTVWVGSASGLGRFEGARYRGPVEPPRIALLGTSLGARAWSRPPREGLEAHPGETSLEVRFAALGGVDEESLERQARMEGVDEWHTVPDLPVRYSSLPPGEYRFEMRARHDHAPWGPVEGFALRVLPPWWASWWGRGLGVLLLGAVVAGVVRWRNLTLRRRNAELERLVEARTSELDRVREKVAQAEKLSAMGQLLARLSHEINNPLTAIHNNLPPVREYFEQQAEALRRLRARLEAHPEEVEEVGRVWGELELDYVLQDTPDALEAMRFATERIRSIQADLRAFLRGERPHLEVGDLNQTVLDTVEFVRRSLPPGAQVELQCGEVPPLAFHAGQIGQVLLNLLRNALDALGERGEVRVSTAVREGRVELVVADNGPGIPPELRSRIFEPFFTTKDVGQGSGLGLAICRQIIAENHGGSLELDESVARGACFRVELPLVQAGREAA
jgi:signal transduction histidine kinase/ligand-binding sensor domain-containing protein